VKGNPKVNDRLKTTWTPVALTMMTAVLDRFDSSVATFTGTLCLPYVAPFPYVPENFSAAGKSLEKRKRKNK